MASEATPYRFITETQRTRYFVKTGRDATLGNHQFPWEVVMGKAILLWLLGVPIPVIILLALIFHH